MFERKVQQISLGLALVLGLVATWAWAGKGSNDPEDSDEGKSHPTALAKVYGLPWYPREGRSPKAAKAWVDSVFSTLSPDQRLGQLFMMATWTNKNEEHYREIESLVRDYHIGGLIFMQGGPHRQARLTNRYQSAAQVPLLIAMDAEWGLSMRLDSTLVFPRQMSFGAARDPKLMYELGGYMAWQCRTLGVHVSFSPDVDVNSNPRNPVIGIRSFGEDKEQVAALGVAYAQGLQDQGVIANAKHFPGHGDTDADSHYSLPMIKKSKEELSETELYPFRALMNAGVLSFMAAHLQIPALDSVKTRPSSISPQVIGQLLRKEMGYQGLVFTDALNMKGASAQYQTGDLELMALQAGVDVLLFSASAPVALKRIKQALKEGKLSQKELDRRVKRILAAKYWAGLDKAQRVETEGLAQQLFPPHAQALINQLHAKAATLVKNEGNLLPVQDINDPRWVALALNTDSNTVFLSELRRLGLRRTYALPNKSSAADVRAVRERIGTGKRIILSLHLVTSKPGNNYALPSWLYPLFDSLSRGNEIALVQLGIPYALKNLEGAQAILTTLEPKDITEQVAAGIVMGALPVEGRLPVNATPTLPLNTGISLPSQGRLGQALPEEVNLASERLVYLDTLLNTLTARKVIPGGQLLVAKEGQIVFHKAIGKPTYAPEGRIEVNHIYDVASVTKVAATTLALMDLWQKDKLGLDVPLSVFLPELRGSNLENTTVRQALTHRSGLPAHWPFWQKTLKKGRYNEAWYRAIPKAPYTKVVAPNLYIHEGIEDSLTAWISRMKLSEPKNGIYEYRYSDLGMFLLKRVAERLTGKPLDRYCDSVFYRPLGMYSTGFQAWQKFPASRLVPTEKDSLFRHATLQGYVNDEMAALAGGVAGHAGLFSTAHDLATLMQMMANGGTYGGKRYLSQAALDTFTTYWQGTERGLGWDKPRKNVVQSSAARYASARSFGHTGFTGTIVWADPQHNLVFVFLSNRVWPDRNNNELVKGSYRPRLMDVVYEALFDKYPHVRPETPKP